MALSTSESLATLPEANAYAAKRNWSDWDAAEDEAKEAALRDATDYILASWRWPRFTVLYEDPLPLWPYYQDRPAQLKQATIEAARLALTGPLVGGATAGQAQLIRKRTGLIEKEWAPLDAGYQRAERLGWVNMLLRACGAVGGSTINVKLLKA